jgi:hypothetical protein
VAYKSLIYLKQNKLFWITLKPTQHGCNTNISMDGSCRRTIRIATETIQWMETAEESAE